MWMSRMWAVIVSGSFRVPDSEKLSTYRPMKLDSPTPKMVSVRPVTFWLAIKVMVSTA